jgi:hypothetical protein
MTLLLIFNTEVSRTQLILVLWQLGINTSRKTSFYLISYNNRNSYKIQLHGIINFSAREFKKESRF